MARQKITPCLWFDGKAEEAAAFYVSLFKDSAVTGITPGPNGRGASCAGQVSGLLAGIDYMALNGGTHVQVRTRRSRFRSTASRRREVDELWEKLSEGGSKGQCGWLKDRYGLSWQVVPAVLPKILADKDPRRTGRAMEAMMKMTKLDIQALLDAAEGK